MFGIGIASGIGKVIGSIIFAFFLSAAIFSGVAAVMTDHDNLQGALGGLLSEALQDKFAVEDLQGVKDQLLAECGTSPTLTQSFEGAGTFDIDCNEVSARPAVELPQVVAANYLDSVYFRSYDCDFVQCFNQAQGTEKLAVITSQHANSFFSTMMWVFAALAVVGIIIIAASVRHLFSIFKIVGIDMIVAGIPGFFIGGLLSLVPLEGAPAGVMAFVDSILSFLTTTYLTIFVIGLILAIIGFALSRGKPKVRKRR